MKKSENIGRPVAELAACFGLKKFINAWKHNYVYRIVKPRSTIEIYFPKFPRNLFFENVMKMTSEIHQITVSKGNYLFIYFFGGGGGVVSLRKRDTILFSDIVQIEIRYLCNRKL